MCNKLQHETQIKIKMFLEIIIPYGKNINKESLRAAIAELEYNAPKTPVTPRTRSLKDFFTSPATRSAQTHKVLSERNRELRKLMNELEVERFEKADLQEDLRIQQNKVQSLQNALREQTAELKALRNERVPNTPQSCKKSKNTTDLEHYYRREVGQLEDELIQKQFEIDKLETENDSLYKKVKGMERQYISIKEKLRICEKSLESMQIQGELKDREIVDLRITNEELRTHLKEFNRTDDGEQSFEIDGIVPLTLTVPSLNTSEALSSVIEIQLQEAKEESAALKTEIDVLNKKLDSTSRDYKNVTQLLEEKTVNLQDTEAKLRTTLNKFAKEVESLQTEKKSLINENQRLEKLYASQKTSLLQIEETKNILTMEVDTLKEKIKVTENSLNDVNVNNVQLNDALADAESEIVKKIKSIQDLNNLYDITFESYDTNLKKIILNNLVTRDCQNDLDDATTAQLIEKVKILLDDFNEKSTSQQMELKSLKSSMEQMELKTEQYQSKICELEKNDKQSAEEISKLKETIARNITEINKLNAAVNQYSTEISCLREVELEKQILEKDLYTLKDDLDKKSTLLKSSTRSTQNLKETLNALIAEFRWTKEDILNQLNECQKQSDEIITNILNAHKILHNNFTKEQLHRKEIEDKLADNEKELKDNQNLNTALENNLVKTKQTVSELETALVEVKQKLTESIQKSENLQKTNKILEKQQEDMEGQNEKVLLDLNMVNDKLKLAQEETSNSSNQLKLKTEKITHLIAEVTSLKLEKEHVIHLQQEEESNMKSFIQELEEKLLEKQRELDQLNIEIKLKQETLELVQNKFEKLSKETVVSEIKMKEVIMNLQEVRTTQDTVLTTQEKALKEKALQMIQLEKEFMESKSVLYKQFEDEKTLCQSLQSKNSELQIELYKQMKTLNELQEVLKREKIEHDKSKEYSKILDTKMLEIAQICNELEYSVNDLRPAIANATPANENFYNDGDDRLLSINNDSYKTNNILNTVKTSINEVHASRKLILYLSNVNTNLNETLENQKVITDNYIQKCKETETLKIEVQALKNTKEKHVKHLNNLIKRKESLRDSLQNVIKSRKDLDTSLDELKEKWDRLLTKSGSILEMDNLVCDKLKQIQVRKTHLENTLSKYNIHQLQNIIPTHTILWQKFLWTEQELKNTYLNLSDNEEMYDICLDTFSDERTVIEAELQKNVIFKERIIQTEKEIDDFANLVTSLETDFKSNGTKYQSETEKKLQFQIDELIEEKNNVANKLDCARMKNAKLEEHIDELREKINELRTISWKETEALKEENLKLQEERDELSKRPRKEDVDNQLKDIYEKYKIKLDEMKLNMKTAYNEQVTKLNKEQEQCVQERLETLQKKMEIQCRKQADELSKYKAHVAGMSSQIWNVGEKLLSERQEKEKLQKELVELKLKYQHLDQQLISSIEHRSTKYEKRDLLSGENKEEILHKVTVIEEKTAFERRCSIRSIQTMGNAFNAEDEEGEVFDNIYLADMKNGFHPLPFTEEEIKTGSAADEMFNDSLSQSLLPEQKAKKKDRTQTSYKKPGPPTPSKNGGRLSLQGNELKSPNSRILRERNKDRATATPRTLKSLFTSRRQDENVSVTPRGRRRSNIFRRYRGTTDR
ncbi:hypothetical protein WN55_04908 [Dufourea novaeangliae]|uniref:Uncharacterized protein n=1 Tax=Dufourea novaeangliae TaxID=178035 RepID=A0A154PM99_DUFNO|nr:hypothetical protein WN55_04908 [Dufourea novaeangliae]